MNRVHPDEKRIKTDVKLPPRLLEKIDQTVAQRRTLSERTSDGRIVTRTWLIETILSQFFYNLACAKPLAAPDVRLTTCKAGLS